jgi:hypothetical protein
MRKKPKTAEELARGLAAALAFSSSAPGSFVLGDLRETAIDGTFDLIAVAEHLFHHR